MSGVSKSIVWGFFIFLFIILIYFPFSMYNVRNFTFFYQNRMHGPVGIGEMQLIYDSYFYGDGSALNLVNIIGIISLLISTIAFYFFLTYKSIGVVFSAFSASIIAVLMPFFMRAEFFLLLFGKQDLSIWIKFRYFFIFIGWPFLFSFVTFILMGYLFNYTRRFRGLA